MTRMILLQWLFEFQETFHIKYFYNNLNGVITERKFFIFAKSSILRKTFQSLLHCAIYFLPWVVVCDGSDSCPSFFSSTFCQLSFNLRTFKSRRDKCKSRKRGPRGPRGQTRGHNLPRTWGFSSSWFVSQEISVHHRSIENY